MILATEIRTAYFQALSNLKYKGVSIPIFDEIVNPNVQIPNVDNHSIYVILQNQQSYDSANQGLCCYKTTNDITIRIVAISSGLTGSKKIVEEVAKSIDTLIRIDRDHNKLSFNKIRLSISKSFIEKSDANLAFTQILIYQNEIINK